MVQAKTANIFAFGIFFVIRIILFIVDKSLPLKEILSSSFRLLIYEVLLVPRVVLCDLRLDLVVVVIIVLY